MYKLYYPWTPSDNQYQMFRYPGGEAQVRFNPHTLEHLQGQDKVRVIARVKTGEVMELALLADALHYEVGDYAETELVLPYLPYARADRRFVNGDCAGLKVFGTLIDAMAFNRVITLDAHSPVARRSISNLLDVSPNIFISKALADIKKSATILFPDKGARKRYHLNHKHIAYCEKERDSKTGKLLDFMVPLKEDLQKRVLIVDDICDGGGTFIGIADKMKDYELDLYLYVTHGIFSKGGEELAKRFKKIYTTDSFFDHAVSPDSPFKVFRTDELWDQLALSV